MTKRVLITGGTGFLGVRLGSALKSRYEVILADLGTSDQRSVEDLTGCKTTLLDITKPETVCRVFEEVRPSIVIHAAANKFVALGEKDPFACVDVNIIGSQNVARAAMEHKVNLVVAISSNAATPPHSSMYGLAKAILERMFCSLNVKTKTQFTSVRLGNVAWSTGSVLPIWSAMLAENGVIETTGLDQSRFFCSADDAVQSITTAIDHVDELAGKVLVRKLNQAPIKKVLEKFVQLRGEAWKQIEGRQGERAEEALIGDLEVPYTRETVFDGVAHYVISFNEKAALPIAHAVLASNAEPLSADEIDAMIASPV